MRVQQSLLPILLTILIIFSCKTIENNTTTITTIPEREIPFEFTGFNFIIDKQESLMDDVSGLYTPFYRITFGFINKTPFFSADYTISDNDGNVLLEKSGIKPTRDEFRDKVFEISDTFTDIFTHETLFYTLTVSIGNEKREFKGQLQNPDVPLLQSFSFGPFITRYENETISTSLAVSCQLENCRGVEWIRLIPPSRDSFWNIPWKQDLNAVSATGSISDQKSQNLLNNGKYVLQINLGYMGTIQREFTLQDFFNNDNGPNYGLPIANQLESGKDYISLDIDLMEKIDHIEIWLYAIYGDREQKLGTASFTTVTETISKKEIRNLLLDDYGNNIKVKNNKDYWYRVLLYSKEFNSMQYLSISDAYPISFKGFLFFPF